GTGEHRVRSVTLPEGLPLGPAWLYPAKTAVTRVRSIAWLSRRGRELGGVRILIYHRISDERDVLAVRPRSFARQMAFLADHGFRGVDVAEVGRRLAEGDDDPSLIGIS